VKKSQKIIWHILLWITVFIPVSASPIIIFILNQTTIEQVTPGANYDLSNMIWQTIIGIIRFVIVFYVFYFIIYNLLRKKYKWWVKYFLVTIFFSVLVIQKWFWNFLPLLNLKGLTFSELFAKISTSYVLLNIIMTIFQGGLALVFRTLLAYFDEKKKRKELETANLKNELNMLRSQVNPHFIFNTLNNIDALILKNPKKASELLIKLSDEMRYILYDANIEKIEIESELKFLNNYISLQKIRINQEEPIRVNIDLDNPKEKIPPMLFLPLVENAFKHGRFVYTDDVILLSVQLKNHHLNLSITNPYDAHELIDDSHKGLGLDLVKRRFDLIFPKTHKFGIKKDEQYFTVEFSIDLNEA
jgi:two-component system, LytTR family, sensor kinase